MRHRNCAHAVVSIKTTKEECNPERERERERERKRQKKKEREREREREKALMGDASHNPRKRKGHGTTPIGGLAPPLSVSFSLVDLTSVQLERVRLCFDLGKCNAFRTFCDELHLPRGLQLMEPVKCVRRKPQRRVRLPAVPRRVGVQDSYGVAQPD